MQLHVGTSGFGYKEWIGPFYPEGTRPNRMLAWYASRFDAVEIINTFYRFPTPEGLAAWAAQVPAHFRFALKAPQVITHRKRLRDVDDDLRRLLDAAMTLQTRLGPLLFQCPPRMPLDVRALQDVTDLLPPGLRAAFEFRDPEWLCEPVYELLTGRGCALCFNDTLMPAPRATADWGYVRLRSERHSDAKLSAIATQVISQPWREAYVFIKHEAPDSPLIAQRWRELAQRIIAPR